MTYFHTSSEEDILVEINVPEIWYGNIRAVPEKNIMGVFDDTFILPPPPMRLNYCLGPPSI